MENLDTEQSWLKVVLYEMFLVINSATVGSERGFVTPKRVMQLCMQSWVLSWGLIEMSPADPQFMLQELTKRGKLKLVSPVLCVKTL